MNGSDNMAYTVESNKAHGYVKLTFLGLVKRNVLDRYLVEIYLRLIKNSFCKIFIDITRYQINVTPTELYVSLNIFRSKFLVSVSLTILARPDQMESVSFFEKIPTFI